MQRIIKILLWLPIFCMGCIPNVDNRTLYARHVATWSKKSPNQAHYSSSPRPTDPVVLEVYSGQKVEYVVGSTSAFCCATAAKIENYLNYKIHFKISVHALSHLLKSGILDKYPEVESLKFTTEYANTQFIQLKNWLQNFNGLLSIENKAKIEISQNGNKLSAIIRIEPTNREEFFADTEPISQLFIGADPHSNVFNFPGIVQC